MLKNRRVTYLKIQFMLFEIFKSKRHPLYIYTFIAIPSAYLQSKLRSSLVTLP